VWGWGINFSGQLGNGSSGSFAVVTTPVPLSGGPSTPVAVAAGGEHSFALDAAGKLFAWGARSYAQLGEGSPYQFARPTRLGSPTMGFTAVSAGLALESNGTLWAFPAYDTDLLSLGDGFTSIASGSGHHVAVKADGTLWAWGPTRWVSWETALWSRRSFRSRLEPASRRSTPTVPTLSR
jgi:alpha-tubulin suppressor-like RCC1 family protein